MKASLVAAFAAVAVAAFFIFALPSIQRHVAWKEGERAFTQDVSPDDNPYQGGSRPDLAAEWKHGWWSNVTRTWRATTVRIKENGQP